MAALRLHTFVLIVALVTLASALNADSVSYKPRVINTTDLGADPDDEQSMVRQLVCANEFDIEGLIVSTGCWKKEQSSTKMLDKIVDAYAECYDNLKVHADGFPTPEYLRSISVMGQKGYGMSDVGDGKDSLGSELIIASVDKDDPRPVWVGSWGGANNIAQAIWKVKETRSKEELRRFLSKLRVFDILGQDDAGAWIAKNYPEVLYIRATKVYGWQPPKNGTYQREDIQSHGPMGAVYPDTKWATEGDTPAFMHIYPNGLNDPDKIDQGGWGGRFSWKKQICIKSMRAVKEEERQYDPYEMYGNTPDGVEAIKRWSKGYNNDFAARMDWSITDQYEDANHHPIAVVNGDKTRRVLNVSAAPGSNVTLNAVGSSDPDKDALFYAWSFYKEPSTYDGGITIKNESGSSATVSIPVDAGGKNLHVILEVHDNGEPNLYAYRRVIINVSEESISNPAKRVPAIVSSDFPPSAQKHNSPHRTVEPIPLADVKWTRGFWNQRFSTCRDKMVPSMWEIMKGTQYKPFFEHFRIAAGISEGAYHGAKWNDGDFYKWIEAVCAVQAIERNPEWDQRLDDIISVIGKAQRDDGYIHTPVLVAARNGDKSAKPFADRFNFEMYNMGHLMTAACRHHEVTGKNEFVAIARKAADFLDDAFRNPTPDSARHAICPSHYMGILDLYRTTGERRYLELAQRLIRMRDLVSDGGDDNQDRVPFLQQHEAVGHAVRATYLYAGVADLYAETGDDQLHSTLNTLWHNVVEKKMYITGACGALYDGASPDGSKSQKTITRVHQAFGRNYQLPSTTAHNETCANIGNTLWNWRMFLNSGEAKYVDVMELALYNSVLSGVSLDGKDYFYTNPLRQLNDAPVKLRWSRTRVPFVTSFCCPPNVVRTVASVNGYAYSVSGNSVWVNLYGSNTLETELPGGRNLRLEQQTNYPWSGDVQLKVVECDSKPFAIKLRIPGWAKSAALRIDGEPAGVLVNPGSYATIDRSWQPGTTIELSLDMPAQLIEPHPLVEETMNQVAVKRGPIVYCLESNDLPSDVSLLSVRLPIGGEWKPRFDARTLDGVTVLEGTLVSRNPGDWNGKLYREFNNAQSRRFSCKLIPYFVWSNRGPSEMTVWLPID
jgi:DUF1680 family protein